MFRSHLLKLPSIAAAGRSFRKAAKPSPPSLRVPPPVKPWPQRLDPESLIAMLSRHKNHDLALQIFRYAGDHHPGFSHTYDTYLFLVRRLAQSRAFSAVESLLSDLQRSGLKCGEYVFVSVIRSYGLAGQPEMAVQTFLRIEKFDGVRRSARSLNSLLNALVQNGLYDEMWSVFETCKERFGVVPNAFTGNILIKALCDKGDLEGALKLLDEMPAKGLAPNVVCYTTVMRGYVSRGDSVGAERVFGDISGRGWVPDSAAYTVLMDVYSKQGRLGDAAALMDEMEEKGVPRMEATYGVMIKAYCDGNMSGEALGLLEDMVEGGKYAPSWTLCCKVIDALCRQGKLEEACCLWERSLRNICTPKDANAVASMLVGWLCKSGKVGEARKMFERGGLVPSVSTYNAVVKEGIEIPEERNLSEDVEKEHPSQVKLLRPETIVSLEREFKD